jgi:hypothetical protein
MEIRMLDKFKDVIYDCLIGFVFAVGGGITGALIYSLM